MATLGSTTQPIPIPAPPSVLAMGDGLPTVHLVPRDHADRKPLEQYIHDRFAREYEADINKYMPWLIRYGDALHTHAAVGFRCACDERLFLETYLSRPAEEELGDITDLVVRREKIIEVGNLAATKPGASAPLFGALAAFLDQLGFEWVMICATPTVQNVFSKLQIPLLRLAEASREALPRDQQSIWGSYYQCRPLVMAVHVRTAHRCMRESMLGKRFLASLQTGVDDMAMEWRSWHG